jgi:hypothetical protein
MTSFPQIEANRRNALRSTGPKTEDGKRRSRHNAVRHGLTAETVIVALEDIRDYQAFEAAIIADYDARTAVERELVLRLASLLWRIRRATAIETDLLQIQAEILSDRGLELVAGVEKRQHLFRNGSGWTVRRSCGREFLMHGWPCVRCDEFREDLSLSRRHVSRRSASSMHCTCDGQSLATCLKCGYWIARLRGR